VTYGATMPKIIEKGKPMSQVMIVVEFEVKPEHTIAFAGLVEREFGGFTRHRLLSAPHSRH
jgi:hypothetical protein